MMNETYTTNKINTKFVDGMMTTRYQKRSIVSLAFLLSIWISPCDGIGSWRKKTTAVEPENTDNSNSGTGPSNSNNSIDHDMNKTYLDLFGESAKEFLTQKAPEKIKSIFPKTDNTCRWDWKYIRCEPYCECSFQPKLPGDFHLGRACRKRTHLGRLIENQNGTNENPFERNSDQQYQKYCTIETNNNGDNGDALVGLKGSSPPPPSIPSPFPFLAKSSKATLKILRSKTDPVVARAVGEFEAMHGRVQTVVCRDIKSRCDDTKRSQNIKNEEVIGNYNPSASMDVAWQERLFCRDLVRDCMGNVPEKDKNDMNDNSKT